MFQVLTSHGCFEAYLKRFKIQGTDTCPRYGVSSDDAEHGFFLLRRVWENWRRRACTKIDVEEFTPENINQHMLVSKRNGSVISSLITRVMTWKGHKKQGQPAWSICDFKAADLGSYRKVYRKILAQEIQDGGLIPVLEKLSAHETQDSRNKVVLSPKIWAKGQIRVVRDPPI